MLDFGWQFEVLYIAEIKEIKGEAKSSSFATIELDWRYLKAVISVYVDNCYEELDELDELEKIIIHELLHMLVNPLQYDNTPHRILEYVVTSLTKIVCEVSKGLI